MKADVIAEKEAEEKQHTDSRKMMLIIYSVLIATLPLICIPINGNKIFSCMQQNKSAGKCECENQHHLVILQTVIE